MISDSVLKVVAAIAEKFWDNLPAIIVATGGFLKILAELRKNRKKTDEVKADTEEVKKEVKENTSKTDEVRSELKENTSKTAEIHVNTNSRLTEIRQEAEIIRKELEAERATNAAKISALQEMVALLKEDKDVERKRVQAMETIAMQDLQRKSGK